MLIRLVGASTFLFKVNILCIRNEGEASNKLLGHTNPRNDNDNDKTTLDDHSVLEQSLFLFTVMINTVRRLSYYHFMLDNCGELILFHTEKCCCLAEYYMKQ